MKLLEKLRLAQVKRWPICSMNREQSVAEHSYGVMMVAAEIVNRMPSSMISEDFYLKVIAYALVHDLDEVKTGDIPSPFKRRLRAECPSVIPVLDGEEKAPGDVRLVVKFADYIEALHYLREYGGSRYATGPIQTDISRNFSNLMQQVRNDDRPGSFGWALAYAADTVMGEL